MAERKEDWFTDFENLKPVRGGRRAATLNNVAKNAFHVSDQEAESKFRAEWEKAKESEDPLEVFWQFCVWFDEHFPSGKPNLFYPMLYKICTHYGNEEKYQHDERLLKLWIILSENFPERGLAVFDFAHGRGSLKSMAKFYVRWSEIYERLGNINKARDRLEFGLRNRAMPITVLHEAQQKLEMRLMRDSMKPQQQSLSDHEEQEMDQGEDMFTPCAPRKQFARLRGVGEKLEAPMFRVPKGKFKQLSSVNVIVLCAPGTVKMPHKNINSSFEIYEDEVEEPQTSVTVEPQKTGRIADEFADDPEFQSLFGFFNHRSKTDIHLNISENVRKPSKKMGLKDLPLLPPGDDFEIFTDEMEASQETRAPLGEKKPQRPKLKMCLRKEICRNEMSIEELYAQMIEQKQL